MHSYTFILHFLLKICPFFFPLEIQILPSRAQASVLKSSAKEKKITILTTGGEMMLIKLMSVNALW